MAGFNNITALIDAIANGQTYTSTFRKVPSSSQQSTAFNWSDLSMISGFPIPNYYASSPLVAALFSGNEGIYHGADKSPYQKHLIKWSMTSPTAGFVGAYKLADYLLYYPFIDMDSTDLQTMTNGSTLPRYTTGAGVMAMAVAVTPSTGGGVFTFDYVNQDGVSKTSPTQTCGTSAVQIGTLVTGMPATGGANGPFLMLASGDTGIRSITSITNTVANGGLISLVLVYPMADHTLLEINTENAISYVKDRMGAPRIYDGAYLNMIVQTAASYSSGSLLGHLKYAWN